LLLEEQDSDPFLWWDVKGASDAAQTLRDGIPLMISHWEGLRPTLETRTAHEAMKTLQSALDVAMPYIKWPFGRPERHYRRQRLKAWHLPAVQIAFFIIEVMVRAGHNSPGITRNSVVARVVRQALIRMGYLKEVGLGAIGAHLTRWDQQFGLTPKGIAALTTKLTAYHM
jgi:hypothetical protein